jgi:hypothetical protein
MLASWAILMVGKLAGLNLWRRFYAGSNSAGGSA